MKIDVQLSASWLSLKFAKEFLVICGNSNPTDFQISFVRKSFSWILIKQDTVNPSERERAFLFWIAQGYSFKSIAKIMNIKIYTVQTYSKRIKIKLGCASLAQAIFVAMQYKELPIDLTEEKLLQFLQNQNLYH